MRTAAFGHAGRPADEDVPLGEVGDELAQALRREQPRALGRRVVADEEVDGDAALGGELLDLVAEDEVLVGEGAVEDDDVAARLLHERAHGRDADAAGDERDLVAAAARVGEDAERPLGEHARADRKRRERAAVIAERLHGDPQRPPVGRRGERERMRAPPAARREEAPDEELAGARAQPVETAAGDPDGDDARPLVDDGGDAQPVAEHVDERDDDAEDDEERERRDVERPPVVGGDRVEHELVAGRDLVEPAERDPRVREEVHGVPPLVAQPPPHDDVRGADDGDEQAGADGGGDHPRVDAAAEHRRDLLADGELVHLRVAPDAEEHVRDDEVDRRVPVPAVPDGEPVEADEPLDERQAREQDHLDEREVGAEETRDAGDARQRLAGGRRVEVAAVGPEPDDAAGVAEDERPDEREPGGPVHARTRGGAGRSRDCHLGHGVHSSNGS